MPNLYLIKGSLTKDRLDILETSEKIDEQLKVKVISRIFKKLPSFIFEKTKDPRTLIFEDALGYDIIKIFYIEEQILFLLIRFEGKIYTSDEIKKFSLKINRILDVHLPFSELFSIIQENFV